MTENEINEVLSGNDMQVHIRHLDTPVRGCDLHVTVRADIDGLTYQMSLYCCQTTPIPELADQIVDGFSPENLGWIAVPLSQIPASCS